MQRYIAIYLPIYSFAKIQIIKDISKQKNTIISEKYTVTMNLG